jgi:hypothetical protein
MLKVFQNFENELRNNYIKNNENNMIIIEYHNNCIQKSKISIQICENIIEKLKNSIENIENAIIDTLIEETIANKLISNILNEINDDTKIKLRPIISKLYKLGKEREILNKSYNHNYSILENKEVELNSLKQVYDNLNKQIQKEIITNYYDNIIIKNDFERFLHNSFALLD